jgi:DNA-binding NarL/FixJ family response regulator
MSQSIRVYLVEDHAIMRESLVNYLTLFPDIELCGSAGSAEQAVSEIEDTHPSLVLLDLSLPGRSGFDLLKDVTDRFAIPCLVLSGHREKGHVERAMAGGARGYVLKGQPQELPIAIRKVMRGDRYLSAPIRMFAGDAGGGPH